VLTTNKSGRFILFLGGLLFSLGTLVGHAQTNQPANSWVNGAQWYCNSGYKKAGDRCISIFAKEGVGDSGNDLPSKHLPSGNCAENGSCYGDVSPLTGRPKTVHVQGYFRRDGTYVRGHYRSRAK
jgi:hypothetical protein